MPPRNKRARLAARVENLEAENQALRAQLRQVAAAAPRPRPREQVRQEGEGGDEADQEVRAPQTWRVVLQDDPRDRDESEARDYEEVMEKLPENLADQPTELRLQFEFRTPTMVRPATMTVDIDINAELRRVREIPEVMEMRLTQIADGVLPEWYAHATVGIAYRWAMTKANYEPRPQQDRGRVILSSSDLRQRRISTRTVPIEDLPDAVLRTIEDVMNSNNAFDVNKECSALVQIMVAQRGGNGNNRRPINTSVRSYFARQTLLDPDWVQPPMQEYCMALAVLMSTVRHINPRTGDVSVLDHLEVPNMGNDVCADVLTRARLGGNSDIGSVQFEFARMWPRYQSEIQSLYLILKEVDPNIPPVHEWTEKMLGPISNILRVCIHVVAYDVGCTEVLRFGKEFVWDHIYILRGSGHYYAVYRPHLLFANNTKSGRHHNNCKSTTFCDRCLTTTARNGPKHRLQCFAKPIEESGVSALLKRRMQNQYRPPFEDYNERWGFGRLGWCQTCDCSVGLIKPPSKTQLEELPFGLDYYKDMIWEMKNAEDAENYNRCRQRGHELEAMYFKVCSSCREPIPSPYRYWEKFKYLNQHVCRCQKPTPRIGDATKYWVWDLECLQRPINGVHELPAILVCACNLEDPEDKLEFVGLDCIDRFMNTILSQHRFENTTWIAHNGSSFDVQYICRWLHAHGLNYGHVTSPGSMHSYQEVTYLHLRFIDSVKFIPMPLAAFGKTFGLEVCKGDFPLRFATAAHLDYEGAIPPIDTEDDWYNMAMRGRATSPEESQSEIDKFIAWYNEEKEKYWTPEHPERPKWKFMEQLKRYCWLDVEVLRQGCRMYRATFLEPSETVYEWTSKPIDPFQYMTMPQCLQTLFLAGLPETQDIAMVPRIPKIEYRQSQIALQWLLHYQSQLRVQYNDPELQIRHIFNSPQAREYYVGLPDGSFMALDGYLNHNGKEHFFQFHGCYWHGCVHCFPRERNNLHPHRNIPYEELYRLTCERMDALRSAYPRANIIEMWEHDFTIQALQADEDGVFEEMFPYSRFDTDVMTDRDIFYGGRVEVFDNMNIADVEAGEEIKYIDVVSHYPHICAFKRLCTGHPLRLLGPEIDLDRLQPDNPNRYFGFFRGIIRPNPFDRHGGLPRKEGENGQLVFSNGTGFYCGFLEELYDRLEHGAEIVNMYEVLHFDEHNSREGPFRGYIAKFFRDKMEASGWEDLTKDTPFEGQELDDAAKHNLAGYLYGQNKELCAPRPDKVAKNPGKRNVSKICVNSIWGKFVQKDAQKEKIRVTNSQEYFEVMNNDHIDATSIQFNLLTEGMYECTYEWTKEFVQRGAKINPYLGASVTGWARTILHRKVREVDAIYCDTDSVVYRHIPDKTVVTDIGAGIGQWQHDYSDVKIVRFYALGPKCYCLVFDRPNSKGATYAIKAKGITMHASNHAAVQPDDFLRTILANFDDNFVAPTDMDYPKISLQHFHIGKDIFNRTGQEDQNVPMIAISTSKSLSCTFTKRIPVKFFGNDFFSLDNLENMTELFDRLTTVPIKYGDNTANIQGLIEHLSRQIYAKYYEELEWWKDVRYAGNVLQGYDGF